MLVPVNKTVNVSHQEQNWRANYAINKSIFGLNTSMQEIYPPIGQTSRSPLHLHGHLFVFFSYATCFRRSGLFNPADRAEYGVIQMAKSA